MVGGCQLVYPGRAAKPLLFLNILPDPACTRPPGQCAMHAVPINVASSMQGQSPHCYTTFSQPLFAPAISSRGRIYITCYVVSAFTRGVCDITPMTNEQEWSSIIVRIPGMPLGGKNCE